MYGFYRIASAVPTLRLADIDYNIEQIVGLYHQAEQSGCAAVVFPELCITGYSCGDLFFQPTLTQRSNRAALQLAEETKSSSCVLIFGMPLRIADALYNVAVVAQSGKIRGIVPKMVLPNNREFYEKRQFRSGKELTTTSVRLGNEEIPIFTKGVFESPDGFSFGIELCEDLWSVIPPSSQLALAGAKVLFNLSASTELTGKASYRRDLVRQQSGRCYAAYAFSSAGVLESTTDVVFGGHALIADNGRLAAENERFLRSNSLIMADVDLERLGAARLSESSFNDASLYSGTVAQRCQLDPIPSSPDLEYAFNPAYPFVPNEDSAKERCQEILAIQVAGLAKRVEHTNSKTLVIGISGGLDSTLALLVASECCQLLNRPATDILAVTMPGFGTTGRTYNNAVSLCKLLGVSLKEVDIKEACLTHFKDIGHDPADLTTTYENVQARERTQILMDLANKLGGMVVGTGDLSEIALGWSTYNGDHMSMYAVNCSIPKTLIRRLIRSVAEKLGGKIAEILEDINATPVSPELLPASEDGNIDQKTEDILGAYDMHDFFLYHFIKCSASPAKLLYLAEHAFAGQFSREELLKCLKTFLRRFFTQQFKRSCIPDGPKVGSISLSPRGDWRMPSDSVAKIWLDELENL